MKAAEIVREASQDCPNGPVTAARRPPCRAAGRIVLLAAARQNARLRARHGVPSWASSSSQIIAAGDELEREARAPAYLKLSDAFSPTAQSPRPARPPAVRVRADGYFSALRGELHSDFQSAKRHRAGRADAAGCGAVGEDPYAMPSLGARRLLRPRHPLRSTGCFCAYPAGRLQEHFAWRSSIGRGEGSHGAIVAMEEACELEREMTCDAMRRR